jgi:hypothetical protein
MLLQSRYKLDDDDEDRHDNEERMFHVHDQDDDTRRNDTILPPRYKSSLSGIFSLESHRSRRSLPFETSSKERNNDVTGSPKPLRLLKSVTKKKNRKEQENEVDNDSFWSSYTSSMNTRTTNAYHEEYSIDSFLRGEYDGPFAEDAAAPHPELSPSETVESALWSLRQLDIPERYHGAAVFMRFLAPLARSERWGGGSVSAVDWNPWKEIVRGSLTPTMLAGRMRASREFAVLLDWDKMDVTEGVGGEGSGGDVLGSMGMMAFVNVALFFATEDRKVVEPCMMQFQLKKVSGVWLVENVRSSKKEWFLEEKKKNKDDVDGGSAS